MVRLVRFQPRFDVGNFHVRKRRRRLVSCRQHDLSCLCQGCLGYVPFDLHGHSSSWHCTMVRKKMISSFFFFRFPQKSSLSVCAIPSSLLLTFHPSVARLLSFCFFFPQGFGLHHERMLNQIGRHYGRLCLCQDMGCRRHWHLCRFLLPRQK